LCAALCLLVPAVAGAQEDGEAADAPAAEAAPDTDAPPADQNFLVWMLDANGWLFGLIFLTLSFVTVALITLNILKVRRQNFLPEGFVEDFEAELGAKNYQGAYELAREDESVVARVLAAGLGRLNRGYPEAVEAMQEVGEDENMAYEHSLSYLALLGAIAPMLGLLGTVSGMISSFQTIAQSTTAPKPAELAQGISQALFTTLEGLAIAIPAMVAYSLLRNRVARYVLEVGIVSEGLMQRFSALGRSKKDA
jgi:biopolymer transport protein ExbB